MRQGRAGPRSPQPACKGASCVERSPDEAAEPRSFSAPRLPSFITSRRTPTSPSAGALRTRAHGDRTPSRHALRSRAVRPDAASHPRRPAAQPSLNGSRRCAHPRLVDSHSQPRCTHSPIPLATPKPDLAAIRPARASHPPRARGAQPYRRPAELLEQLPALPRITCSPLALKTQDPRRASARRRPRGSALPDVVGARPAPSKAAAVPAAAPESAGRSRTGRGRRCRAARAAPSRRRARSARRA